MPIDNLKIENSHIIGGGITPTGTILSFASEVAPDGWLVCDGQQVSRSTYAELYSVIGDRWGEGDGSTTFHLPDLRGRFLRGHDSGAGNDPDAAGRSAMNAGGASGDNVGSVQDDEFTSHDHTPHTLDNAYVVIPNFGSGLAIASNSGWMQSPSESTGPAGGNETRPINANVSYIIKI